MVAERVFVWGIGKFCIIFRIHFNWLCTLYAQFKAKYTPVHVYNYILKHRHVLSLQNPGLCHCL